MSGPGSVEKLVWHAYGVLPRRVEPFNGDHLWKIYSSMGVFILKRSSASVAQLDFVAKQLDLLAGKRFASVLPFMLTKHGDPYICSNSGNYYLLPWVPEKPEKSLRSHMPEVIRRMAEMHHLSMEFLPPRYALQKQNNSVAEKMISRWEKEIGRMEEYEEVIREKTFLSPFEVAFLANGRAIQETSRSAVEHLKQWCNMALENRNIRISLSHGGISRRNVLLSVSGPLYFIDFDHACMDTPIRDLSLVIRRHMPGNGWDIDTGVAWFRNYQQICPLTEQERVLMAVYLLYPERLLRLIREYETYMQRKIPPRLPEAKMVRLLEKEIHLFMIRNEFADQFVHQFL